MNPKVDAFIAKATKWQPAFEIMRALALECGLSEDMKWGQPCYTADGRNIVLFHGFKEYCAFLFFKGALLADPERLLVAQTENTQSARQIRFTDSAQVAAAASVLKAYILEAVRIEASGVKVALKTVADHSIPAEFQTQLDARADVKAAFAALTPGRQRAYLLHFSAAKQTKTREARVEKCIPLILAGKGLNDD
ncbi:DUF1801 domain-containing protein [Robbsia sp. KACC 23696]|uniref:YdeI/OmpD-associated family protein n=1 Tax=Robbsia sp. KACC 23696 TaxID=3149231 RepID=UPI00325A7C4A